MGSTNQVKYASSKTKQFETQLLDMDAFLPIIVMVSIGYAVSTCVFVIEVFHVKIQKKFFNRGRRVN